MLEPGTQNVGWTCQIVVLPRHQHQCGQVGYLGEIQTAVDRQPGEVVDHLVAAAFPHALRDERRRHVDPLVEHQVAVFRLA
jgi:hypothetical protein